MKVKTKKIINITLIIILIIIIIMLFWMLFLRKSFSKYKKDVTSNGLVEIASPILIVDGDKDIQINGIEDTIYNFSVKNYDAVDISEVDMNYSIEIVNNSKAKLTFELTKNGESVILNNNKTEMMNLKGNSRNTDNYELKILYENNPAITENINGNVQIKVEAVQAEVI